MEGTKARDCMSVLWMCRGGQGKKRKKRQGRDDDAERSVTTKIERRGTKLFRVLCGCERVRNKV